MWKKILIGVAGFVVLLALLVGGLYVFIHGIDVKNGPKPNPKTSVNDIAFLKNAVKEPRGKILAVVTSTAKFPAIDKKTGYELSELSRAYYIFVANGFEVDIASPLGGNPPVRRDDDDMKDIDFAFLNDPVAQRKVSQTMPLSQVDPAQYRAVYFVGGKGVMFDLPGNPDIRRIVRHIYPKGVVGAVCHGPAALLNVTLDNGEKLIANRMMTGFTNEEELFLMNDARKNFPFLLQDAAEKSGAAFVAGSKYLDNTIVDGRLVTGQNPWSTWSTAEAMVKVLGYQPIAREPSREERSVRVLQAYRSGGMTAARTQLGGENRFDRMLFVMHAVVSAMQWQVTDAFNLLRLAGAK